MTKQPSAFLRKFEAEVLRWNRQMSLVSRVESRARLASLLTQSVDGVEAVSPLLADRLSSGGGAQVVYCDIGSGAGIPGMVWHERLAERFGGKLHHSCLVEPRAKRAWFLQRTARLLDLRDISVFEGRWGESPIASVPPVQENAIWLLSLKALCLSDKELAAPWREAGAQMPEIWICRYLPPGEERPPRPVDLSTGGNPQNTMRYVTCGRPDRASATLSITILTTPPGR